MDASEAQKERPLRVQIERQDAAIREFHKQLDKLESQLRDVMPPTPPESVKPASPQPPRPANLGSRMAEHTSELEAGIKRIIAVREQLDL